MKTKKDFLKQSIFLIASCLLLSGCADFIRKTHQEMAAAKMHSQEKEVVEEQNQTANSYQRKAGITSHKIKSLPPTYQHSYLPPNAKTFKASDFEDHSQEVSLWYGEGKISSLYGIKTKKKEGDTLNLQIAEDLFNEINFALNRAHEIDEKKNITRKPNQTGADEKPSTEKAMASNINKEEEKVNDKKDSEITPLNEKIFDKINCKIIAELDPDTLQIQGVKNFFHQKKKRTVQIEATVSRKDINFDDSIISTNINQSKIKILR